MSKFNKSEILKAAWNIFRTAQKWVDKLSFGECLKRAWATAKKAARVFTGIVKNVQVAGTLCHPVLVDVDMDNLTITGNTFPVRQMMRERGFDWDAKRKAWTGTREALNALCVEFA